jgi:hypothetical protein
VALVAAAVFALGASAAIAAPWTGSGTGTTTVVSDGTSGTAEFTYSFTDVCCATGNWTFSTIAGFSGPVQLDWAYSGYNAFFEVTTSLSAFVTSSGGTTTFPLVNDGPVDCCTPPSGGFAYSGSTTVNAVAGDTYGFTMGGSNGDSDGRLLGTLTVTGPSPLPPRTGYCAAAGNTDPRTGAAIVPGTFLDLVSGQPASDEGKGLTCDPPPAGFVRDGFAGAAQLMGGAVNPLYRPAR